MNKRFWLVVENMSSFAKSFLLIFALGFIPIPFLINAGYNLILVSGFSIALMSIWSDGFLTLHALKKGATEINPLMNFLNKIIGEKKGFLVSRICGSVLPLVGLLLKNVYFVLLLALLFSALVCLSSFELAEHSNVHPNIEHGESNQY
jgi:hypothetical protein